MNMAIMASLVFIFVISNVLVILSQKSIVTRRPGGGDERRPYCDGPTGITRSYNHLKLNPQTWIIESSGPADTV